MVASTYLEVMETVKHWFMEGTSLHQVVHWEMLWCFWHKLLVTIGYPKLYNKRLNAWEFWRFWRPECPVNGRQQQAATRRVRRVNSEPSLPTPDPWFDENDLQTACYRCLGCKILNQGREMARISFLLTMSGRTLFNVISHGTWPLGLHFQLHEALKIFFQECSRSRCQDN